MSYLRLNEFPQHIRSLLAVAIIALTTSTSLEAAQPGSSAIGDWKFTAVLDNVEITSIDDDEAKKFLGRIMKIRRNGTKFGDQTCGAPSLETERVEPNIYVLREAKISARKLFLPNPVDVIDIGCTHVFIKKRDKAVIFWDGFFFGAVKIK